MVSADGARFIVGIIGNVISFFLFLSPAPTFRQILKKKDTEQFKADPYLATLLNCMLWVFYGIPLVHPHSVLVVSINGIGFVLEAIYLVIYFTYANRSQRMRVIKVLVIEFAFMFLVCGFVLGLFHTHKKRTYIVGVLCVIFGSAMYASPLTVMKNVITTRSVKYMPFYLSLANFLNGICWTAYALIEFDLFVLIPNGAGAVLGGIQLLLYGCYYRSTKWDEDDSMAKPEMQLPTTSVAASR